MTSLIRKIFGREVLDSRGEPTVEVEITLDDGSTGRSASPAGSSTGAGEAVFLRDKEEKRFGGKGVRGVVKIINEIIAPAFAGKKFNQTKLDKKLVELDGTENKSRFGGNATLPISLAFTKATAAKIGLPLWRYLQKISGTKEATLPRPLMNILNGGKHATGSTDFQEFIIAPPPGKQLAETIRAGVEIYQSLKTIILGKGFSTAIGDEGGFCPPLPTNESALDLIWQAVEQSGWRSDKTALALDAAANEFWTGKNYFLKKENKTLETAALIVLYERWLNRYPLVAIEDGLAENDHDGWQTLTKKLGNRIMIVGDDIFTTNQKALRVGIQSGIGNAIIIKPNQIGTLTETLETIALAKSSNYEFIISHRSGETEDVFISHLAVGTGAKWIKAGAPARGERVAKYNELLRIAEEMENL
jgi:enolase